MNDAQKEIRRVAVLAHQALMSADGLAKDVEQHLSSKGVEVRLGGLGDNAFAQSVLREENDLVVALGGDGTMLRAGELAAESATPVLGINMGRLGFLMEVKRENWRHAIDRVLQGEYWLEPRARIAATLFREEEEIGRWEALNECVVGRGRTARPIRVQAEVDDHYLATYVADAVICATATGSTAYALAAGGPILPPQLRNMLLVPVAPHLSADEAIVLPENATLIMKVGEGPPVDLSCDGWLHHEMAPGDRVEVMASPEDALFVRLEDPGYFFRNLTKYVNHDPPATGRI
ncbi:MAG: NAD(+)/NADH kinase [Anaerolineales bacterium]